MEVININGHRWRKTIGDEGQDVLVAEFMIDEDKVIGEFPSEKLYDLVIDKDTDLYLPSSGFSDDLSEDRVAFKFRKNTFSQEEQDGCLEGLYEAAKESNNRGKASGPRDEVEQNRDSWLTAFQDRVLQWYSDGQPTTIDGTDPVEEIKNLYGESLDANTGTVWLVGPLKKEFGDFEFETLFDNIVEKLKSMSIHDASNYSDKIRKDCISLTTYANQIWSGIAGFYDRYPRIPFGRATAYTEQYPEKFAKSYPFARKLDNEFARLLPERYARQKVLADKTDSKFLIGEDTTFTTVTVNTTTKDRNARMACHRDAGSLNEGFSNLTVISDGKKNWKGGYLVTPEVRVAINVRPGDLLLVDNMRIIHGNTPIEAPETGEDDLMRMSLIFYYREKMKLLGSWEYESIRKSFVSDRSKDRENPLWWERWNGVSADMWAQTEWYEYLESKGGKEMVVKYHPEAYQVEGSLEEFFG